VKSRFREINVFSMSALDLFAAALGAFIIIAVVLFPFYPNTGSSEADVAALRETISDLEAENQSLEASLEECERQLADAQEELERARQELEECQAIAKRTFVLALISWSDSSDVDLHVVDPAGREFYFRDREFPGSEAALEEDNINGPGNEIWLHPSAEPGEYRVYANLFSASRGQTSVRGAILHQEGKISLPDVVLRREDQKELMGTVIVSASGEVSVR
jgi:outer membrane murein-binding lipoprotein Lpp